MSASVKNLLQSAMAGADAVISPGSAVVLGNYGAQIQAALGISVDDIQASEVMLLTGLLDDSGSIRFVKGNTEAVRDGHNGIRDALLDSKQAGSILSHTRLLNAGILHPYVLLADAVELDTHNYDPRGGTPLYDMTIATLGAVVAKAEEFRLNGVVVRTVTMVLTDGHDEGSRVRPDAVLRVVSEMLRTETHIIGAVGIADGYTDFRQIFGEMGIPDQWILTPQNTPSDIRRVCQVFSRSAVRASQNAASFSKTLAGGFAAP